MGQGGMGGRKKDIDDRVLGIVSSSQAVPNQRRHRTMYNEFWLWAPHPPLIVNIALQ